MEALYQGFATAFPLPMVSKFGRDLLIIIAFAFIFNLKLQKPKKDTKKSIPCTKSFPDNLKSGAMNFFLDKLYSNLIKRRRV